MPDIDFGDAGFDESTLAVLGLQVEQEMKQLEAKAEAEEFTVDTFREAKKASRDKARQDNQSGQGYNLAENDYVLNVVFANNQDKRDFMQRIRKDTKEKYIKSTVLYDIYNHVYDLSLHGVHDD